jgi:hypothetical protein
LMNRGMKRTERDSPLVTPLRFLAWARIFLVVRVCLWVVWVRIFDPDRLSNARSRPA